VAAGAVALNSGRGAARDWNFFERTPRSAAFFEMASVSAKPARGHIHPFRAKTADETRYRRWPATMPIMSFSF
jgi:hypothetical protein